MHRAAGAATLRVSVTDRCNLRCAYCMPEAGVPLLPRGEIPPLSELASAVAWLASRYGVDRVKVTGGEPLVRGGLPEFVAKVAAIPGVAEVSMTTNGTRLAPAARELAAAGLARVNVSLDTLDPGRFRELTRGGRVEEVLEGIDAALEAGLTPLKLNSVLRRSSFREDVPALLDLAARKGVEIRFIELMQTGTEAAWAIAERVTGAAVREWLATEGARITPLPARPNAPARRTAIAWGGSRSRPAGSTPSATPSATTATASASTPAGGCAAVSWTTTPSRSSTCSGRAKSKRPRWKRHRGPTSPASSPRSP